MLSLKLAKNFLCRLLNSDKHHKMRAFLKQDHLLMIFMHQHIIYMRKEKNTIGNVRGRKENFSASNTRKIFLLPYTPHTAFFWWDVKVFSSRILILHHKFDSTIPNAFLSTSITKLDPIWNTHFDSTHP